MGLLEAIPEATLEALAAAQPGAMRGRLQLVPDPRDPAITRVGRFGWKAGSPTLEAQIANAFNEDMGVTSPLRPTRECTLGSAGAQVCGTADAAVSGVSDADIQSVARYLSLLGVPPQRAFAEPTAPDMAVERQRVQRAEAGRALFATAQCAVCHIPETKTGEHRFAELRWQTIRPYTDLLLHDMGDDLADTYVQGVASGREWRTAPLWGIGLLEKIDAEVRYLHDGRARTLEEAILWHGGQAAPSREAFRAMGQAERAQLVTFLRSL